jgi:hypothetical protein
MKIILSVVDMFGPTGPKHLEETGEGGRGASRHDHLIYRNKFGRV